MNPGVKAFTDELERRVPQAFQAAHPRNVTPPAGYCNPRYYSAMTTGSIMMATDPSMDQLPHINAYLTALSLVACRVPTYFIAYEFAQAVANTDLPGDFKFAEIKWPLDAQLFVLPDQFVWQYFGCYAPFLAICRTSAGVYPAHCGPRLPKIEFPYPRLESTIDRILVDYPRFGNSPVPTDYNGSYPLNQSVEAFQGAAWVDSTQYEEEISGFRHPNDPTELAPEQEKIFVNKALCFAIKLILAVSCRPGLVEHGQMTRPVKIKQGRVVHREMWSPNIIGRAYRIPRQISEPVTVGASHTKPRFTFRRGHYAWQAKRFKGVEFVSVAQMPHQADGTLDFDTAGAELSQKFRAVHERLWIEGILFGGTESNLDANTP